MFDEKKEDKERTDEEKGSRYNPHLPQPDGDSNDLTTWPAWRKNEHRSN